MVGKVLDVGLIGLRTQGPADRAALVRIIPTEDIGPFLRRGSSCFRYRIIDGSLVNAGAPRRLASGSRRSRAKKKSA
jgi:hypothetical protein